MPPPDPPRVKEGRIRQGKPSCEATVSASATERARPEAGTASPAAIIASLNLSRSSASSMAAVCAPISRTPYFSSTPAWARSIARFRPVCPPTVGSRASGRSAAMIFSQSGTVSGST